MSDLIKPPNKINYIMVFASLFLTTSAIMNAIQGKWFVVGVDLFLISLNLIFSVFIYRSSMRFHQKYKVLKAFEKIYQTPKMQEKGNSIIITMILPQPQLVKDFRKYFSK